ncbi:hypothetical protein [Bacteroides sp.]|uniref:hypothetical protein n=1 Tax=Bacteroides sp. TaxID=29523 RepID=UPI00260874EC|nr:hypothetical protein [Bacteroides sp.]MDD3039006.1 hypothetical protein [Bacteroides sp.]
MNAEPRNILAITPATIFRTSKLVRDQMIYTLFLKEEAANTLYFTVRAAAYAGQNMEGKKYAGKLANSFIDTLKDYVMMTSFPGNIPLEYQSHKPEDDLPEGISAIQFIKAIETYTKTTMATSILYTLTYAGTIAFNIYFRGCLDFMLVYSIPYIEKNTPYNPLLNDDHIDCYVEPPIPGSGIPYGDLVNITEYRRPIPQTKTRFSHSLQLQWNYASFYMFICEEGFQCLQYAIRYLLVYNTEYGSEEYLRGAHLAGRLANWWMDDLIGLIKFTNSPVFAAITRGVSYIGFNSYFRTMFVYLSWVKNYYIHEGYTLQENEYWSFETGSPVLKTFNPSELNLTTDSILNPLTQKFTKLTFS